MGWDKCVSDLDMRNISVPVLIRSAWGTKGTKVWTLVEIHNIGEAAIKKEPVGHHLRTNIAPFCLHYLNRCSIRRSISDHHVMPTTVETFVDERGERQPQVASHSDSGGSPIFSRDWNACSRLIALRFPLSAKTRFT
jgi:hypothetical protein